MCNYVNHKALHSFTLEYILLCISAQKDTCVCVHLQRSIEDFVYFHLDTYGTLYTKISDNSVCCMLGIEHIEFCALIPIHICEFVYLYVEAYSNLYIQHRKGTICCRVFDTITEYCICNQGLHRVLQNSVLQGAEPFILLCRIQQKSLQVYSTIC